MKKIISIIAAVVFTATVFAQAPNAIPYQAVARNSSGVVISNQSIAVRFSIRAGSPTGGTIYQEKHIVTSNALGLFSVNVGQGVPQGQFMSSNFANIMWGSGAYYLQVEMDAAGGTTFVDMGTSQMMSVPYALYAATAGNGGTTGATGATGAAGTNGTNGTNGATGATGGPMPNGTFGQTMYSSFGQNGQEWFASSNLYNNGTRIGVGSTNPAGKVHIAMNSDGITNQLILDETENDFARMSFKNTNGIGWTMAGYKGATPSNDAFGIFNNTTFANSLYFTGDGKAGFGTQIPAATLDVAADGLSEVKISSTSFGGVGPSRLTMISNKGTGNEWRPAYMESGDNGDYTGRLDFFTNGTGAANKFGTVAGMSITNGMVGIGTATPTSKLDVTGNTGIVGHFVNTSTGIPSAGVRGEANSTYYGTGVFGYASAATGNGHGVEGMSNSTTGVGVYGNGIATSGLNYGVYGTSNSNTGIGGFFTNDFGGYSLITENGNVGFGVAAPAARVHINSAGSTSQLLVTQANNDYARMSLSNSFGTGWTMAGYKGAAASDDRLNLYSNTTSTDVVSLTGDGKVGIGNSNPSTKLDVNGQATIRGGNPQPNYVLTSVDNAGTAVWAPPAGGGLGAGAATGNTPYWNGNAWVNSSNIYNNGGNVGINTNAPAANLDVNGSMRIKVRYPTGYSQILGCGNLIIEDDDNVILFRYLNSTNHACINSTASLTTNNYSGRIIHIVNGSTGTITLKGLTYDGGSAIPMMTIFNFGEDLFGAPIDKTLGPSESITLMQYQPSNGTYYYSWMEIK